MSYIRCLSNPEGLYIFGNGRTLEIHSKGDPKYLAPSILNQLLKNWLIDEGEANAYAFEETTLTFEKVGEDFKWRLNHPSWKDPLDLWETTLYYLAKNNEYR